MIKRTPVSATFVGELKGKPEAKDYQRGFKRRKRANRKIEDRQKQNRERSDRATDE
jgi:hypothetical protein